MRLVYIDEAGISAGEPFVIVAAVIVNADRDLIAIERYLDRLVARWIPEPHRDDFVFHATELFNGVKAGSGKPFERENPEWPLSKRLEIADSLAVIPAKFRLPLITGWAERSKFPATMAGLEHWDTLSEAEKAITIHTMAYSACSVKVEHWMRKNAPNEVCIFVVEDNEQARTSIRHFHQFTQTKIVKTLSDETRKFFPFKKIKEDPLFQGKRKSSVLQLADFVAYVSKRYLMGDRRYDRAFDPMKSQFFEMFSGPASQEQAS